MSERRRAAIVLALVVAAAVPAAVWIAGSRADAPTAGATPSASATTPPTSTAVSTAAPVRAAPLGAATNSDAMPACAQGLTPRAPREDPAPAPVPGGVDLRLVGQLGGEARAATLAGDRMFAGSGTQVVAFDIADPLRPREVGRSPSLSGIVEDIEPAGELLVVAAGGAGLAVLDQTAAPRSAVALPGNAEAVEVRGRYAFVADGPGGLRVVDLADPSRPTQVAALLDLHRIVDVVVEGDHAYLAAADEGLIVADVSDPLHPRELGRLFTGGYAFGVASSAGGRALLADGWGGLRVIDVSDPRSPRALATVPTSAWVMGVATDGTRAYAAAGAEGMRVFDLTDPTAPREADDLPRAFGHAIDVSVGGGRAAVVDAATGIRLAELGSGPPLEVAAVAPLGRASGLAVVGDRAFIAAMEQGLRVVDVSDPRRPRDAQQIPTDDPVISVASAGSNVFFGTFPRPGSKWVATVWGLEASAPLPLSPSPPAAGPLGPGNAAAGSLVAIAAELSVVLADGSTTALCRLGDIETAKFLGGGFEANDIAVSGGLAYVAPYYEPVKVFDISDPRAPRYLERPASGDEMPVGKVLVVGSRLYAIGATGEGRVLAVFDLGTPTSPRLLGSVPLPADTANADQIGPYLAYGDGRVFVADSAGGLATVDVSDPRRPAISGRLRLPGRTVGVAVSSGRAYVASDGGGLFVVEWSAGRSVLPRELAIPPGGGGPERAGTVRGLASLRGAPTPQAGGCVVTTTADGGPGSLRDCLSLVSAGAVVSFDALVFPPDRPSVIEVQAPSMRIRGGITVDGRGAGVILDGGGRPVRAGLETEEDGVVIVGLEVRGFGAGIVLAGSRGTVAQCVIHGNSGVGIDVGGEANRIVGNLVGFDRSGRPAGTRQDVGIWLQGSTHVVGGPGASDRNVVAGHQIDVNLKEADGLVIEGNYIGIDAAGDAAVGPAEGGQIAIAVWVGSARNRIAGNVVAGGINVLDPGSSYNAVVGNIVGFDRTGTIPMGEGGIIVSEPFNRIGGALPGEANVVAGGIEIDATDVLVLGNTVGAGRDGGAVPDGGSILGGRERAVIGGRSPAAGNLVVGKGIAIRASGALVIGDRVRGGAEAGELLVGVDVDDAGASHVVANVVEDVDVGIRLGRGAFDGRVRGNVVRRAARAVVADEPSRGNLITGNSFEASATAVRDLGSDNAWDDGRMGNHWSDHTGPDADGDGIVDQQRVAPPNGIDRYPLARPPTEP